MDGSRESTDLSRESKRAEMGMLGCGDGSSTYLGSGDAKCLVNEMDGAGIHMDRSTGQADAPSVQTKAIKPAKATETISIPQKKVKPPDLPIETARGHPDELNSCRNLADMSSICTDGHSDGDEMETAENETLNVRKSQTIKKSQDSPYTAEIKSPKRSYRWRKVSVGNIDVYIPWNVPVEAPSRTFAFREAESRDEAIAPDVEGETAEGNGDGDGDQYGDDGDGDGITSGGSIDSIRVNAALLAVESQYMRQDQRTRNGDLPMSSRPPIQHLNRPYGLVIRRRQHGRIKIESINISQTLKVKKTYHRRAQATQPRRNPSKGCWKVHRTRRQCGRIKIVPANVKIERVSDKTAQEVEMTYQIRARVAQPPTNDPDHRYGVHRTHRQCG